MYEVGRESAKEKPSPLLKIVCEYLAPDVDVQPLNEDLVPPDKEQFKDEQGKFDRAAFLRAMNEYHKQLPEKERNGTPVTPLHYRVTSFISQRKLEAQMLEAHGLLPHGIPYDEQPKWKWDLWSRYWSGENDQRELKNR